MTNSWEKIRATLESFREMMAKMNEMLSSINQRQEHLLANPRSSTKERQGRSNAKPNSRNRNAAEIGTINHDSEPQEVGEHPAALMLDNVYRNSALSVLSRSPNTGQQPAATSVPDSATNFRRAVPRKKNNGNAGGAGAGLRSSKATRSKVEDGLYALLCEVESLLRLTTPTMADIARLRALSIAIASRYPKIGSRFISGIEHDIHAAEKKLATTQAQAANAIALASINRPPSKSKQKTNLPIGPGWTSTMANIETSLERAIMDILLQTIPMIQQEIGYPLSYLKEIREHALQDIAALFYPYPDHGHDHPKHELAGAEACVATSNQPNQPLPQKIHSKPKSKDLPTILSKIQQHGDALINQLDQSIGTDALRLDNLTQISALAKNLAYGAKDTALAEIHKMSTELNREDIALSPQFIEAMMRLVVATSVENKVRACLKESERATVCGPGKNSDGHEKKGLPVQQQATRQKLRHEKHIRIPTATTTASTAMTKTTEIAAMPHSQSYKPQKESGVNAVKQRSSRSHGDGSSRTHAKSPGGISDSGISLGFPSSANHANAPAFCDLQPQLQPQSQSPKITTSLPISDSSASTKSDIDVFRSSRNRAVLSKFINAGFQDRDVSKDSGSSNQEHQR